MMGILGIVASGGSGGGGSDDENFSCGITVADIDPATDSSGDIWLSASVVVDPADVPEHLNRVIRVKSNGLEASSFLVGTGNGQNWATSIAAAVDGSGDVYAGGDFSKGILRLNSDGSLDADFAIGSGFNGRVTKVAPATDGSATVYVAGNFSEYNGNPVGQTIRLNANGSVDGSFNPSITSTSIALATDGSDDIYVGLNRLNSNGSLDTNYPSATCVSSLAAAADLDFGDVYFYCNSNVSLERFNSTGTRDLGFSDGFGLVLRDLNDPQFPPSIVPAVDGTSAIYVGGYLERYDLNPVNDIIRLNNDGSIEANFITGSGFDRGRFGNGSIHSVVRAKDGTTDIYAGGEFDFYNGIITKSVARLNDDGSLDSGFQIRINTDRGVCDKQTNLE